MKRRRSGALGALGMTAALAACATAPAAMDAPMTGFAPRPTTPRVAPVPEAERTPEQADMIARRSTYNIYTTLARHVDLYNRWSPLGQIILNNTTVPPRHREIIMLRMGWLCQSEYEFAQHARIATAPAVGMTAADVDAIAAGPEAPSWTDFERTLLTMVDELRYDAMISDATWAALSEEYSEEQIVTAVFIAAQYQLVSMALNSLGVQLDDSLEFRLPEGHPMPVVAGRPAAPRLDVPRVRPLSRGDATPAQAAILAVRTNEEGEILNLYATMARYPELFDAWIGFMGFVFGNGSSLPAREREMLILRTGWNTAAEYEWAHHVPLGRTAGLSELEIQAIALGPNADAWEADSSVGRVWSETDAALLRAADELRVQAFITDATWSALAESYDTQQMVEIIYTVGGYAMTALVINSLGIQTEPGYPGWPG